MPEVKQQNIINAVKEYGKRLFGFIRGRVKTDEDAEDILQDVWQQLSSVVNVEDITQMSGWLHKVARNKIIDKKRKKTPELLDDMGYEDEDGGISFKDMLLADKNADPENALLNDLFWEALFVVLDELPEAQKNVFVWNEFEDMTLQEIADKTNENIKTIISRKGYAVKHLRKRLQLLYNDL